VIARTWRGATAARDGDLYFNYLLETGVKECERTPGNCGVYVLRRTDGDRCEFLFVSLWESMQAVREFAGLDAERGVFYPEDEKYLIEFDADVLHYEVLKGPAPASGMPSPG
jgi:heme-degrading monooxygenase HmoA